MQPVISRVRIVIWLIFYFPSVPQLDAFDAGPIVPRIVGGFRPEKHTLTKHAVSIRTAKPTAYFGDNHFCAGAIISAHIILTAAHCIMDPNKVITRSRRLSVVAGAPNRLRMDVSTVKMDVDAVIPHPKFRRKRDYDLALLRLTSAFPDDNDAIKIIKLVTKIPEPGTECTSFGWGQLFYNGPYSAEAVYVNLTIISREECKRFFNGQLEDSLLCANGPRKSEMHACRGDSGGPLVCNGKLAGITAFGVHCGDLENPTLFTSVYHLHNWIKEVSKGGRVQSSVRILCLMLAVLLI